MPNDFRPHGEANFLLFLFKTNTYNYLDLCQNNSTGSSSRSRDIEDTKRMFQCSSWRFAEMCQKLQNKTHLNGKWGQ